MFNGGNTILKYINRMKEDDVKAKHTSAPIHKQTVQYDIFTDGSEIKEKGTYKTLGLGWAFVAKHTKETVHSMNGTLSEGNNQRVELLAIYKALEYLQTVTLDSTTKFDIIIHSDSDYSIKSLTVWSLNWVRNQWMTSNKKPVKHRDIIEPCLQMIKELKKDNNLVFNHVRSHTHKQDFIHVGNAEADELASNASRASVCARK